MVTIKTKQILLAFFIASPVLSSAQTSSDYQQLFAKPDKVVPFKVNVPESRLKEIRSRVIAGRIPKQMPPDSGATNWQTGMDVKWLAELRDYWINKYDWRNAEKKLNSFPQYLADIDGFKVHFYYVKGEGENPAPLLLTHGWPGSVMEFLSTIGPLTNPSKYGGKKEDAFTLIIPSLPGFGFTQMPSKPIGAKTAATIFNKLITDVIGYKQYFAQGGDFGAVVNTYLSYMFPQQVKALHINMFVWGTPIPEAGRTEAERQYILDSEADWQANFDYGRMQINKPLMPGVALYDSPLGTAAWIAEKFWAWSDNRGNLESVVSKDQLLTDIMLYLVNEGGIDGSFWFYRGLSGELKGKFHPGYVKVPTALAKFPGDFVIARPPIETAKRVYNIYRYVDMPKGGHFAALEQPDIFVQEIREAFRQFR